MGRRERRAVRGGGGRVSHLALSRPIHQYWAGPSSPLYHVRVYVYVSASMSWNKHIHVITHVHIHLHVHGPLAYRYMLFVHVYALRAHSEARRAPHSLYLGMTTPEDTIIRTINLKCAHFAFLCRLLSSHIHAHTCMYIFVYMHTYQHVHIHIHVHMHVCMYMYMYVCVCTYTYTRI